MWWSDSEHFDNCALEFWPASNVHLTRQTWIDYIVKSSMFLESGVRLPYGHSARIGKTNLTLFEWLFCKDICLDNHSIHTFELKFWMKLFLNMYFRISSREWITGEYSFDSNRIKSVISIRLWSPTISEWFWSPAVCKWIFRDPKSWSTIQWWQGAFWFRIFRSLDPWIKWSTQIKPADNSSFGSIDYWKSFVACSWSLRLNRFNETQAR